MENITLFRDYWVKAKEDGTVQISYDKKEWEDVDVSDAVLSLIKQEPSAFKVEVPKMYSFSKIWNPEKWAIKEGILEPLK